MADIIQLLPDAIANQIAAGEVIQRPASVVKELVENAIDAGSSNIKLIIKDAGKTLIQVIDDGTGMSETDARMSFERHATSKIRQSKDLFAINTMGFRGEALASIAAVAQVELRTRLHHEDIGTRIVTEDSMIKVQEPCQCTAGTNFLIKNLFYNVPARRNFLKSDVVEMRHILDEFQRIAIAHPDVFFSLHHNTQEIYHLPAGNLRQRLVNIFGKEYNKKFVPVSEETDVLRINGFVGKPEFAKKSRGEQFFFVNSRFIKSAYLNHAVTTAYEDLVNNETHPFYVVFIEIDPSRIDINVHPTKQEIKFDDERLVYNYLKVAIRHALGQYSVTPTLDFNAEMSMNNSFVPGAATSKQEEEDTGSSVTYSSSFNSDGPRDESTKSDFVDKGQQYREAQQASNLRNWQQLYTGIDNNTNNNELQVENVLFGEEALMPGEPLTIESQWSNEPVIFDNPSGDFSKTHKEPYQIHTAYIVSQIKSGFMLVDQQAAHERILYEKYYSALEKQQPNTQQELFPKTLSLSPANAALMREMLTDVNLLGFDIQEFGTGTFIIHGMPAEMEVVYNEEQIVDMLLEQYKNNLDLRLDIRDNVARSMAKSASIKRGKMLTALEMQELIDMLFACAMPYRSPSGRQCFITFELDDLQKRFNA